MKKKLLGIIVAVAMLVCALPLSVSATGPAIQIGGQALPVGVYTSASPELSGILTSGTIEIEKSNGAIIVTLTDAAISAAGKAYGILSMNYTETDIILAGEYNKISLSGNDDNNGIGANNPVYISGTGILEISEEASQNDVGYDCGITLDAFTESNVLTIDGATIIIDKADKSQMKSGIAAYDVNFNNAAVVTCNTESGVRGVYAAHDINFNLTKGGKVVSKTNADGGEAVKTGSINTITLAANNVITTPTNGAVAKHESIAFIAETETSTEAATVAVIEYIEPEVKPAGANTGDSNNIALYAIMAVIALAGAGFTAYNKRQN